MYKVSKMLWKADMWKIGIELPTTKYGYMLKPHSFRIFLKLGLGVKNRDFWDGVVKLIFLHHLPNVPINLKVIPIDLDWWTDLKLVHKPMPSS